MQESSKKKGDILKRIRGNISETVGAQRSALIIGDVIVILITYHNCQQLNGLNHMACITYSSCSLAITELDTRVGC